MLNIFRFVLLSKIILTSAFCTNKGILIFFGILNFFVPEQRLTPVDLHTDGVVNQHIGSKRRSPLQQAESSYSRR